MAVLTKRTQRILRGLAEYDQLDAALRDCFLTLPAKEIARCVESIQRQRRSSSNTVSGRATLALYGVHVLVNKYGFKETPLSVAEVLKRERVKR